MSAPGRGADRSLEVAPQRADALAEAAARAISSITGLLDAMEVGMAELERVHRLLGVEVTDTIRCAWRAPDALLVELDELRWPLADVLVRAAQVGTPGRSMPSLIAPAPNPPPPLRPVPGGDTELMATTLAAHTNWAFRLIGDRGQDVRRSLVAVSQSCRWTTADDLVVLAGEAKRLAAML